MSLHRDRGRSGQKLPIEIDLTLSSPSPERQPRAQPSPRNRPGFAQTRPVQTPSSRQTYIKREKQPARGSGQRQPPTPPKPRISPQDMEGIINTSDPAALRAVLLNLCNQSPALSGALVRGLAHHSTYAQNLIQQHRPRPPFTKIKSEQTASARIKMDHQASPLEDSDSSVLISSPNIPSFVKQEHNASPTPSNGSSSTAFSESFRRSSPPPRNHFPGSFAVPSEPESVYQQSALRSSLSRQPRVKVCTRCDQPFTENDATKCFYHAGRKLIKMNTAGIRETLYSCCDGPDWDGGCEMADHHIAPTTSALDSLKRPQPSTGLLMFTSPPAKNPKLR